MQPGPLSATILAAAALTGCASAGLTGSQEADQWALVNARPVGEPENCITVNRIRDTNVRDERTIDFTLVNGDVMRSRLPHACPGLAFDERFAHRVMTGRLCAVDTITVLHSTGRGASCGLGPFQKVEIPDRPR